MKKNFPRLSKMCIIIIVIRKEGDKPDDEEECSFLDLAAAVFDLWYSVFSDVGIKSEYWSVCLLGRCGA